MMLFFEFSGITISYLHADKTWSRENLNLTVVHMETAIIINMFIVCGYSRIDICAMNGIVIRYTQSLDNDASGTTLSVKINRKQMDTQINKDSRAQSSHAN